MLQPIDSHEGLTEILIRSEGMLWDVDVDEKIYRQHEGIAQSDLKTINEKSPLHYLKKRLWWNSGNSPAMVLGKATHVAIFEPHLFDDQYAVLPDGIDRRRKEGKARYEEFMAINGDKIILQADQKDAIDRMTENVNTGKIKPYLTGGSAERTFISRPFGKHKNRINVPFKCRVDYWQKNRNRIVDLKTTICAAKNQFLRSVIKYGYHVQAAFYTDLIASFGMGPPPEFIFVVVENNQPYDVAIYDLDEEFIKQGRAIYREGLSKIVNCFVNDDWSGYPKDKQTLECPDWTKRQWERELIAAM